MTGIVVRRQIHCNEAGDQGICLSGKFRQSDDIANILQAIQEVGKFNFRIITENEIEIY